MHALRAAKVWALGSSPSAPLPWPRRPSTGKAQAQTERKIKKNGVGAGGCAVASSDRWEVVFRADVNLVPQKRVGFIFGFGTGSHWDRQAVRNQRETQASCIVNGARARVARRATRAEGPTAAEPRTARAGQRGSGAPAVAQAMCLSHRAHPRSWLTFGQAVLQSLVHDVLLSAGGTAGRGRAPRRGRGRGSRAGQHSDLNLASELKPARPLRVPLRQGACTAEAGAHSRSVQPHPVRAEGGRTADGGLGVELQHAWAFRCRAMVSTRRRAPTRAAAAARCGGKATATAREREREREEAGTRTGTGGQKGALQPGQLRHPVSPARHCDRPGSGSAWR